MAKLYFRFGAMGSSKTAQALMTKFNYEEKGKKVKLIKPEIDKRDDIFEKGKNITLIKSRIGLTAEAKTIKERENIYKTLSKEIEAGEINVIICDECQFLTTQQITQLRCIVDDYDIPVLCFGLRTDFRTNLFSGSKRLFEIADSIAEIKSVCKCGNKAIINTRMKDGKIIIEGPQLELGGNEKYEGMCHKCFRKQLKAQLHSKQTLNNKE